MIVRDHMFSVKTTLLVASMYLCGVMKRAPHLTGDLELAYLLQCTTVVEKGQIDSKCTVASLAESVHPVAYMCDSAQSPPRRAAPHRLPVPIYRLSPSA